MSFFSDPELYLVWGRTMGLKFFMFRIQRKPGWPLVPGDICNYEENESDARDREKAEKLQALEKRVSDLHEQLNQEKNDKQGLEKSVSDLHEQLIKEKNDMQALEKRVSSLHEQLTKVESDIFFGWLNDSSCGTMSRTICNLYSHQRPRHASTRW
ncbi:hypothetical protein MKX03_026329 [Papaver bracteatum]|nr:hypothetical protein MKX03_026329 [Papaver bracteatum]